MKPRCVFLFVSAVLLFGNCSVNKKMAKDEFQLKILSYNVRNARGMDEITDFDRIANVIKRINADCVALQELDSATGRSGGIVVLNELAKRTGMYAAYNASIDYQGGKYGVGILTKEKPRRFYGISLPGSEEKRSLLVVEMNGYVVCSTHWSLRQPDRFASVAIINEALKKYTNKPVFLAGDLNAVSKSEEIKELSKDWSVLNDWAQPTIPVVNPSRCIDYIFGKRSELFRFEVLQTRVENESAASDHLPVWVNVHVNRSE